jgi:hypothetical protein
VDAKQAALAEQACDLRSGGATFQQIADILGYTNRQAAQRAVKFAADKRVLDVAVGDATKMEALRLDQLLVAMMPRARKGNVQAALAVLRIMERQAAIQVQEVSASNGEAVSGVDEIAANQAERHRAAGIRDITAYRAKGVRRAFSES